MDLPDLGLVTARMDWTPARDELDELKTAANTAVEETSLASRPGKEDGS